MAKITLVTGGAGFTPTPKPFGGGGLSPTPVYRWQILMLFVSILLLINFLI